MSETGYNGWSNHATWALNLHMSNSEAWDSWFNDEADSHIEQAVMSLEDGDLETAEEAKGEAIDGFASMLESWLDDIYGDIERAATGGGPPVSRDYWLLMSDVGTDTSQSAIDYREIATAWIDNNLDGRL